MSFAALYWASKQKPEGGATSKLLLVMLASYADENGKCWPSAARLADDCCVTRRSVTEHIRTLEDAGYLTRQNRIAEGVKQSNIYHLNLSFGREESSLGTEPSSLPIGKQVPNGTEPSSHKSVSEPVSRNQSVITTSGYLPSFEATWSTYPKRAGANSKADTYAKWLARLKDGVDPDILHRGVERYAAFCRATDKIGTEYVMQGARFFGKGRHWEEPWTTPSSNGKPMGKIEAGRQALQAALNRRANGQ